MVNTEDSYRRQLAIWNGSSNMRTVPQGNIYEQIH